MSGPNYDDYGDYEDYDANAEECFDWHFNYLSKGRSRAVLIAWLTARPQDANILVDEILKFLQTQRKFLKNDLNPLGLLEKQEIYNMYLNGEYNGFCKIEGWDQLASEQKVYEISKIYTQYENNVTGLWNIISEQMAINRELQVTHDVERGRE